MVYGAAIGFLFLVLDGAIMTMAQSGFMNPWFATFSPMGLLGFVGAVLWLRREVTE
jgi:lipopolysaccharide export LptBFGC system permease protein LptF